jgi:hypothetical protein
MNIKLKSYIKLDNIFWTYLKIREQGKINIRDYNLFWKDIDLQINQLDDDISISVANNDKYKQDEP